MSKQTKLTIRIVLSLAMLICGGFCFLVLLSLVSDSSYMQTLEALGNGSDRTWISFWVSVVATLLGVASLTDLALRGKREAS
jgi:hypothetical protein